MTIKWVAGSSWDTKMKFTTLNTGCPMTDNLGFEGRSMRDSSQLIAQTNLQLQQRSLIF